MRIRSWSTPLECLLIPLGVLILQYHGIPFWYALMGLRTGFPALDWLPAITTSLTLEGVNVWMWAFRRGPLSIFIGTLTVFLLVSGPLIQTGLPLWASFQSEVRVGGELAAAQRQVDYYRTLTEHRSGWQEDIRKAEGRLEVAQRTDTIRLPLIHLVRTGMLLAVFVLFSVVVPLALRSLGEKARSARQTVLERIQDRLRRDGPPAWMTKETVASLLEHHNRMAAAKPVLGNVTIRRLGRRMGL